MKELIDTLMYENEMRESLAEEVAGFKLDRIEEVRNDREHNKGDIIDLKEELDKIIKTYEPLNLDEEFVIGRLEDDIEEIESIIECNEEYKKFEKDPYGYYGMSEKDFYEEI